jgi:hypothetical protein
MVVKECCHSASLPDATRNDFLLCRNERDLDKVADPARTASRHDFSNRPYRVDAPAAGVLPEQW